MFGLLCGLLGGFWLDREQTQLADRVIRFHVIANSDSPEDQALKLQVRDRVLAETETFYPERATLEEARAALEAHLEELAAAGQAAVTEAGRSEPVTARLERCWFPTKEYDGFALPAGEYTALRVRHRRGAGAELVVCGLPASLSGGRLRDGGRGSGGGILLPGPGCPNHRGGPGLCAEI